MSDFIIAMRARSKSSCDSCDGGLASCSSARRFAASARATSISCACSAIRASTGHPIRKNFDKPERYGQVVLLLANAIPQLANPQSGQQRRMPRQHTEITLGTRQDYLVDSKVTSNRSGVTISSFSFVGSAMRTGLGKSGFRNQDSGIRQPECLWPSPPLPRLSRPCRTPVQAGRRTCRPRCP